MRALGLAKRGGKLPPGLERQLERNSHLPPGLQKRLEPFPLELSRQLPPLRPGCLRSVIGGPAIVVNRRTPAIVDVIHNLLNRSGPVRAFGLRLVKPERGSL